MTYTRMTRSLNFLLLGILAIGGVLFIMLSLLP
jgi:hypothetical protein